MEVLERIADALDSISLMMAEELDNSDDEGDNLDDEDDKDEDDKDEDFEVGEDFEVDGCTFRRIA
jgi:hypothetical protein